MSLAREFEELRIWQDAKAQANKVYDAMEKIKDFGFRDQIQRAAVSVMNNIAEGFERDTRPDFARFLSIEKGSCGEVRNMLYLAEDRSYILPETASEMRSFAKQLSRSIKAFSKTLK